MILVDLLKSIGLERVTATNSGAKCLCPYHNDKNLGSFAVSEERGIAKCFSCGKGQSLFSFLIDQGASFDDAIEYLITRYNADGNVVHAPKEDLTNLVLPFNAPIKFIRRGIKKAVLNKYAVGSEDGIISIPLYWNKKLVGVKYRKNREFWYTKDFNKRAFIYAYAPTEERLYVEGETDLYKLESLGETKVSSTLGATITEEQLALMRRHKRVILCFDNDIAGFVATLYVNEKLRADTEVLCVKYAAEDPGDCDQNTWDKKEIISVVELIINLQRFPEVYAEVEDKLKQRLHDNSTPY